MIQYATCKKLNLKIWNVFNTIINVKDYKHFLPWCKNSWEQGIQKIRVTSISLFQKFANSCLIESEKREIGDGCVRK